MFSHREEQNEKWLLLLICSLFGVSLSGCSLQNVVESVSPSREETPQDIHPDSTRVYMDEIQGTLQTFTGNKLTLTSSSQDYTFDVSQATLESVDGMVRGDSISVIYEGQLSGTDTSTVRTLKVVDDYHDMDSLKERTTHGQVQELTTNSITIKSKGGKTATFPITGTEQYYQNGIKAGKWVYIHFKGEMDTPDPENPSHYMASIRKFSVYLTLILSKFPSQRQHPLLPKIKIRKRNDRCVPRFRESRLIFCRSLLKTRITF